ncbi:hypothetical protein TNCV_1178041 [Trichonephila clavipes]|nr:hypothetical protein TNCV_1178041 [Trichonephila clavipes]
MSFRSGGGGGNVPPFHFSGVYVADDLVRARFPTKDQKGRMSITNPSVTFIQVHSPAKRAYRSYDFKNLSRKPSFEKSINKLKIEAKMASHKLRKSAPLQDTSNDDIIVYDEDVYVCV